jgi:hypothetical protein
LDFQDHNNYHLRHILAGLKVEEVKVEEMMRVLHYNHNILQDLMLDMIVVQ